MQAADGDDWPTDEREESKKKGNQKTCKAKGSLRFAPVCYNHCHRYCHCCTHGWKWQETKRRMKFTQRVSVQDVSGLAVRPVTRWSISRDSYGPWGAGPILLHRFSTPAFSPGRSWNALLASPPNLRACVGDDYTFIDTDFGSEGPPGR